MDLFLIIILALSVKNSGGEVVASDGDVVDCVDINKQPAFGNPLLNNHKIQELPFEYPTKTEPIKKRQWQTREATISMANCPRGTIPQRRYNVTIRRQTTAATAPAPVHEYAVIKTETPPELYRAKATINVWDPTIEKNEMSISQIWISSGTYKTRDLNTIEVGWQVLPELYKDNKPRLFIFWTRDAYQHGCYNLHFRCAGFIQTSSRIVLGGSITPTSSIGGSQYEVTILVWKDRKEGNWWLSIGPDNLLVGYWPGELFTTLVDSAKSVAFGGEILNSRTSGRHTRTQMGSGHFPEEGFGKTSYFRSLEIVDKNKSLQGVRDLEKMITNSKYYDIKDMYTDDDWGTHIFYGGPGFTHSGADSLALGSICLYLLFSLFLYSLV